MPQARTAVSGGFGQSFNLPIVLVRAHSQCNPDSSVPHTVPSEPQPRPEPFGHHPPSYSAAASYLCSTGVTRL